MGMKFKKVRNGWVFKIDFHYRAYNPLSVRWFKDIKTLRVELPNCATYAFGKCPEAV